MEMAVKRLAKTSIILLTDCLADLTGGAERQIYELAKALDKDKFSVTVASLECVGQTPRHLIEGIGCRLETFRVVRVYGLSGFIQGLKFFRFLRTTRADIVQTYHFSSDIWGVFWAHLAGVPVIISNRRDMGFWRSQRHVAAYKWVNRWVHKIVAVSESIKRLVMSEEGVPEEKIEVVYNGIHLPENGGPQIKNLTRKDIGAKEDDLVIMHVANLTPVKGHAHLLQAMARVLPECPKAKLVLVGEGPLRGQLTELAGRLGLTNHVVFLGKREDAGQLLNMADICVLPSISEGMSNAILEYMAAGKPVVTTSVGGNPELVQNGETGILVDKENSEQLAKALVFLANTPHKRAEMGRNGYERVKKKFTMSAMVSTYTNRFASMTENRKKCVLHLVSSNGLYGAERVILNLAQDADTLSFVGALHNAHNPHLEMIDEAQKMGLRTAVFNSRGRIDLKTIFDIKKFLRDNQIDILHTHNYKSDIVGFWAALLGKTKWVATNHVWHGLDRKLRFYEKIDAFVLRFAARVVAVSNEIKEDLVAQNIPAEKVQVIDNGIDIDQFSRPRSVEELKEDLGIHKDDVVVTIVGRLSPEKGHETFLKAAKDVLARKKSVKFLVVGDGPISDELRAMAAKLGLNGHVTFTGARKDMDGIYAVSDLMVNASSIEGLPMTILEAMAAKVALIVTPVGAVPKVIQYGINGVIFPTGDALGLSKEICLLIDEPSRRKSLIEHAYQDVCERFSSTAMVQQYKQIYESIA